MARFALLVRREFASGENERIDVLRDTFDALCVLGHSPADARKLVDQAVETGQKFKDTESMIQAIYKLQLEG
jgi:Holliday junction DNA helicase RuvA